MTFTLSVVSHGQGALIRHLFADLQRLAIPKLEIVLTLNIPEDEHWLSEYKDLCLRLIRNNQPNGFGSNHNQAFQHASGDLFCVINPDVRLPDASFLILSEAFEDPKVASCAPRVLGPAGELQDSARRFPTLKRIARRVLLRQRGADYPTTSIVDVDWTAGMFVVFRREAFIQVGGFNERFFMYLEDADICQRFHQTGWRVLYQPAAVVIHDARRASHRSSRHLRWHARSMARFLTGL